MSRHLKTRMINGLSGDIGNFVPNPVTVTPHARGVRYFEPANMFALVVGKINSVKEGRRYKKHIISRRTSLRRGLFQVYTYHFPKTWSAACVANRNLIKEAQRQAHALEHDHTVAALEWRIRFFSHYFNVFKGGKKPEPGMKPYSRFYQYVYVAIYRQLQAAQAQANAKAEEAVENILSSAPSVSEETSNWKAAFDFDVPDFPTFEPVTPWKNVLRPRNYRPCRPIAKRPVGSPSRPLNFIPIPSPP